NPLRRSARPHPGSRPGTSPTAAFAKKVLILISDTAMHEFLLNMREALLIWAGLIGLAVAGFVLLTAGTKVPKHPWRSARAWLAVRRERKQEQRTAPLRPSP